MTYGLGGLGKGRGILAYYKRMAGQKVYLSPIDPDDMPVFTQWANDLTIAINMGTAGNNYSERTERDALEHMAAAGHHYAIVRMQDDQLLGAIHLKDINHQHRRATMGLFIGESKHRGQGYGREAMTLLLGYAFQVLNLHNIMLQVFAFNEGALTLYRSLGFREFGRRHECYYLDGRFYDDVHLELLSTDFEPRPLKLL